MRPVRPRIVNFYMCDIRLLVNIALFFFDGPISNSFLLAGNILLNHLERVVFT
ncbi:hypothetical protein JHK82_029279 [Glycine max]|uniref:Uncharacterized protein n=2 Tax=Glycine subgen. Soja TaxID=1462606 RepID=K7LLI5_SOYBN|nr:hypothetical protein JHK87_029187 [Glycine soja]KAG4998487.1 hypothetical protein JHK85_029926 [Glycine max]KAG5005252.1 hypothetical protein JHK86_029391 [Glycine max]KAG5128444.1 hypothetical protein JHK82_029279 [Glycine max]KAG5153048.1 hypothetical protein JHK84_029520 [Glycine max]